MHKAKEDLHRISTVELSIVMVFVTLITGSSLDELLPTVSKVLRILAYGSILSFSIWHAIPLLTNPRNSLKTFVQKYRFFLLAVGFYFVGLVIGGLRGPDPLYSLWQTFSDAVVFLYAFVVFGVVEDNGNQTVVNILKITAVWTGLLLLVSLVVYIGNLAEWWLVNPYYHPDANRYTMLLNGPFGHSNHFAYLLMIGAAASGYLALLNQTRINWKWAILAVFLCIGIVLTFGRGSMLGAAASLLIIITYRNRKVGLLGTIAALALIAYLVAGALSLVSVPSFIPKLSFAGRSALWGAAIENLREYGPLGVGSGQAYGTAGMGIHNFFLEQYGEGGIFTTIGIVLWLVIPIVTFGRSVLDKKLKVAVIAVMVSILVHGLFWNQFLNGLRFLTLIGVLLWNALATMKTTEG